MLWRQLTTKNCNVQLAKFNISFVLNKPEDNFHHATKWDPRVGIGFKS
jgi:hypothetical protein